MIEVADSYTFVSEDQPELVARAIAQFVHDSDLNRSPLTTAKDAPLAAATGWLMTEESSVGR